MTAKLEFTAEQGGVEVKFTHEIGKVTIRGLQISVSIPEGDPDEVVVEEFGAV